MRALMLYETDYDKNNKLMGRAMMSFAEGFDLIAPEQYGSRKDHNAQDQSLNKALTCNINRQSKDRLGLIPVDLKSCYDRMVHSATGMSMKSRGCPEEIIESSFSTIQELKHYLRSRYGDSTKFFEEKKGSVPIQGCGQGIGAGPGEWAVVSTSIFNSMRKRGFVIYLRTPLSNNKYHFMGYAFVDDTDLVVGDIPGKEKPISLIPLIQEAMI
jgi:hypothetical protein